MARPLRISVAAAITSSLLAIFALGCGGPGEAEPADSSDIADARLQSRAVLVGSVESVWRGELEIGNACVTFVRRTTGTLYGVVEEDGRCENAARMEDRLGAKVMITVGELRAVGELERAALRAVGAARFRRTVGSLREIDGCLFGRRVEMLERSPFVQLVSERRLSAASRLTELEAEQLVATLRGDGMSAAEAFSLADGAVVDQLTLVEPATGRSFVAYQYATARRSEGAVFARGEMERVASIEEGEFGACTVAPR